MNINAHIQGKTIDLALTDGQHLILRCTNGQEFRIAWKDGEPVLVGVDVRIQVALPAMVGV